MELLLVYNIYIKRGLDTNQEKKSERDNQKHNAKKFAQTWLEATRVEVLGFHTITEGGNLSIKILTYCGSTSPSVDFSLVKKLSSTHENVLKMLDCAYNLKFSHVAWAVFEGLIMRTRQIAD